MSKYIEICIKYLSTKEPGFFIFSLILDSNKIDEFRYQWLKKRVVL